MARKKPAAAKRTARRKRAVAGLVAGKSPAQIARDEGCSRETIDSDLRSDEAQLEASKLIDRYSPFIELLLQKALIRIDQALDARRVAILSFKSGITRAVRLKTPDYAAQMAAIKRIEGLAKLGRSPRKAASADTPLDDGTYESWTRLQEKHREHVH